MNLLCSKAYLAFSPGKYPIVTTTAGLKRLGEALSGFDGFSVQVVHLNSAPSIEDGSPIPRQTGNRFESKYRRSLRER